MFAWKTTYIHGKSLPRSGQTYLSHLLRMYFGAELRYCESYIPSCCRSNPCKKIRREKLFYQKSHDFNLSDSISLDGKYLIQFRSPVPLFQSYYERNTRLGDAMPGEDFETFALNAVEYYIGFYRKWIAAPRPNDLVVSYEEFVEDTERSVQQIICFMQGHRWIRKSRLKRILGRLPSKSATLLNWPRTLRDPRGHHADPDFLARIERRVARKCGTDRIRYYFLT